MTGEAHNVGGVANTPRRFGVLIAALAVFAIGRVLPLPGVDIDVARATSARLGLPADIFAIFAIGVTPIVSSALLLELVQLVFPGLRRLCGESVVAATRMQRVWLVLSLAFAGMQAHGIAGGMVGLDDLVPDPDGFVWLVVVTMVGATALLFWLSAFLTGAGFGDGLWLLYAAGYVGGLVRLFSSPLEQMRVGGASQSEMAAIFIALAIALVFLVVLFLRTRAQALPARVQTFVWPAMIGFYGAGLLVNLLRFFLQAPTPYGIVHFAIMFALILLVAFMRDAVSAERLGAARVTALAVAETIVCAIVSVVAREVAVPFGLEAPGLVATTAVLAGVAVSILDARGGKPTTLA